MTSRRRIVSTLGTAAISAPFACITWAQGKIPRIGFLISESLPAQASRIDALQSGLRDLGYVEGKSVTIEVRSADGNYDRLPGLATELVRSRVDALVAFGAKAALAARAVTTTVPIVVPSFSYLVELGLASSLSRPGGNVTGLSLLAQELVAKRLELLKETAPRISRVAALLNPAQAAGTRITLQKMRSAAKLLRMELQPLEVRAPDEITAAFTAIANRRIDAVVVQLDTLFAANAREIARLALQHRLPAVGNKDFADAGGLIGYGANVEQLYRRAAVFLDKILKGAKPGDLPIEQPTRFELVINMKTAKALDLKVPQSILLRATEVIE